MFAFLMDLLDSKSCSLIIIAFLLIIAIAIGINFFAVWLWGVIAVGIFGLPALGFWSMFGLRFLLSIILPSSYFTRSTKS